MKIFHFPPRCTFYDFCTGDFAIHHRRTERSKKCAHICTIEAFYRNFSQALNENQMKKYPKDSINCVHYTDSFSGNREYYSM